MCTMHPIHDHVTLDDVLSRKVGVSLVDWMDQVGSIHFLINFINYLSMIDPT